MTPYIVCHMMASLDGRIDCAMTEQIESGNEYYDALALLDCPSTLMGRVTMQMHYATPTPFDATDSTPIAATSHHRATEAAGYLVAMDTHGTLRWPANEFDGMPLLVVTSESCPKEYHDTLTAQGISWIATGKGAIDLHKAMTMLRELFGVERLSVTGGGHINAAFLTAGLLDEISMMYAPGIDGRSGMTASFDGITDMNYPPTRLRLNGVQRLADTIWLRYSIV